MSKHIGIVGCSAEGAALCYRTICAEAGAMMGEHCHPEISMHTYPLSDYMKPIVAGDWEAVGRIMAESATKLADIGADFVICPDNTIHQAYETAQRCSSRPWLHIARAVAEQAVARGFKKVGITGTAWLMSGPVYSDAFSEAGVECLIPSAEQQSKINDVIFEKLVKGQYTDDSRQYFLEVFAELGAAGCDSVVMGCTEIPILMDGVETPLPTLDSTRTLARAALALALQDN